MKHTQMCTLKQGNDQSCRNKHIQICTLSLGMTALWTSQTGLCQFGWVWSSLRNPPKIQKYKTNTAFYTDFFEKFARTFAFFTVTQVRNPLKIVQKTCSDELFYLGGFFRVDLPPLIHARRKLAPTTGAVTAAARFRRRQRPRDTNGSKLRDGSGSTAFWGVLPKGVLSL